MFYFENITISKLVRETLENMLLLPFSDFSIDNEALSQKQVPRGPNRRYYGRVHVVVSFMCRYLCAFLHMSKGSDHFQSRR